MLSILFVFNLLLSLLVIPKPHPIKPVTPLPIIPTVFSPLMMTTDGGQNWLDLSKEMSSGINPISFNVINNEYFVGSPNGLYRGTALLPVVSWKKELIDHSDIIGIYPGKSGPYAVSMWNGFYQYEPLLGQWISMHENLEEKAVFAVAETTNGNIITGTHSGIYTSPDHGLSWNKTLVSNFVNKIEINNGVVFACGEHGMWRSADNGMTWEKQILSASNAFFVQALQDRVVAIVRGQDIAGTRTPSAVFQTKDNGKSWQTIDFNLPNQLNNIYDIRQVGQNLFVGGDEGLYRSSDKGHTWELVLKVPEKKGGFFRLTKSEQNLFALYQEGC